MELEFDKEIDAILRKNALGSAAVGSLTSAHLEADEIAAFAENALPPGARVYYIKHLADCDRCRSVLAQTISLVPEAEIEAASSAVTPAAAIGPEIELPWYQKLFAIPNMAASLGTLVLVFAGFLGYLIYQQNFGGASADVARLDEPKTIANGNGTFSEPGTSSANAAANAANTAANTASPTITSGGSPLAKAVGQEEPNQPIIGEDRPVDADKSAVAAEAPKPPPATAPMAKPEELRKTESDDKRRDEKKKADNNKDEESKLALDGVTTGDTTSVAKEAPIQNNQAQNNAVGGAAMKSKSGPYRDMQQRNNLPLNGRRVDELTLTRAVAGKSFEKKEDVWYDSAYHGQATINVRRGTDQYRALDAGLRNIAENMSGTVVIVWKSKAYRIQ